MSTGNRDRRTVPAIAVAALAAGVLITTGCGSGGTESAPSATPVSHASTAPSAGASAQPARAVTVEVNNMKFAPDSVTVPVGGTVTWKFADRFPHAVQGIGDAAMGINSPIYARGEWNYTFTTAGTYRYLCPLHPEMRGSVTVE